MSLGILPAYGGTLRLARFVGRGNALNIALTGRKVGAEEALRMGMVVAVLPQDALVPEAMRQMQAIADMPPQPSGWPRIAASRLRGRPAGGGERRPVPLHGARPDIGPRRSPEAWRRRR